MWWLYENYDYQTKSLTPLNQNNISIAMKSLGDQWSMWHLQSHFFNFKSKEQSWPSSHVSPIGHSPGHSSCLWRLQKYVSNNYIDDLNDGIKYICFIFDTNSCCMLWILMSYYPMRYRRLTINKRKFVIDVSHLHTH